MDTTTKEEAMSERSPAEETGVKIINAYKEGKLQRPGSCRYVEPETGLPCAVGTLLPEYIRMEIVKRGMNRERIIGVATAYPEVKTYFGGLDLTQLSKIQSAFDHSVKTSDSPDYFPSRVKDIVTGADLLQV
jgi:hypothetical protein